MNTQQDQFSVTVCINVTTAVLNDDDDDDDDDATTAAFQVEHPSAHSCFSFGVFWSVLSQFLSSVQFSSVQRQDGIYALGKAHTICAPPRLSEVSPTLPLKQFQCSSD